MSSVVRQDLLALFCADRHKQNDRGVVTLDRRKVRRMSTSDVVHVLEGLTKINGTGRSLSLQFFWRDDLRVVRNVRDATERVLTNPPPSSESIPKDYADAARL